MGEFYRFLLKKYYFAPLFTLREGFFLFITHRHWPEQPWSSQPELARILSAELGWELDYRSLSKRLRTVHRFDHSVRQRIFELIGDKALYAPDFRWDAFCGQWNLVRQQVVVPLHQN